MNKELITFFRDRFNTNEFIPLHIPSFNGNEKKYLNNCIDSTFVSSVGPFVDQFEELMNHNYSNKKNYSRCKWYCRPSGSIKIRWSKKK